MATDPLGLTLGVEEEFHLVDLETRRLVPRAPEVLDRLPASTYAAELQRCVVETNTDVATGLAQLRTNIEGLRRRVVDAASGLGIGIAAAGTVPLAVPDELAVTETPRYRRMLADYQLLAREQLICGLQVHVGIPDRDLAVAVGQRIAPWLPVFLAISASSPFWANGEDTGYASARSLVWQRWPTAGSLPPLESAAAYDELVAALIGSGVVTDPGMMYFDLRPSAHVPTLELRVCDACPAVDDVLLIAGLYRAAVRREIDAVLVGKEAVVPPAPLQRAAMWRAARSGLDGDLVDLTTARPVPAADLVRQAVADLRGELEELGDWDTVSELAEVTLHKEGSAARQRRALRRRGELRDVVDLLVWETLDSVGAASRVEPPIDLRPLACYVPEGYDEAIAAEGVPRTSHVAILDAFSALAPRGVQEREDARNSHQADHDVTFRVHGEEHPRLFPVDLVPRVVPGPDWRHLRAGLTQRALALDAFLQDVYAEQAVVRDGILPAWVVGQSRGLRESGTAHPPGDVRAHVIGLDLVSDAPGRWMVLEDNLRVPSGIAYAVANRRLTRSVMPELAGSPSLLDVEGTPALLLATLEAAARSGGDNPSVVLLSDGPEDSAWFEHRTLAAEMDVPLVGPGDLRLDDGALVRSDGSGWAPVDVVYARIGEEALAARAGADGVLLGSSLTEAVRAGRLVVANAQGNGIGDDKAVYAYVPRFIEYYLGERPLLRDIPTYACGAPEQRAEVLRRLEELVLKPVDGYGGQGVVIGPRASERELVQVRERILADPFRWVAQETVTLSTHPTFDGRRLDPRHVDLRAFVFLGDQAEVAPAALTRVAPAGSLIVNSSSGGGSKDTWLLG